MVKALSDPLIKAKNDKHARAINGDRTTGHRITPRMRDSVTGYGECDNPGCQASYYVGYRVKVSDDPIITDDTASNTRCPYVPVKVPVDDGAAKGIMPSLDDPIM